MGLLIISRRVERALRARLSERFGASSVRVALGMRYGSPSIADGLRMLRDARVRSIIVLPMYPQAAAATTASTFDAVASALRSWRYIPPLRMIMGYHDNEVYILSLVSIIRAFWEE